MVGLYQIFKLFLQENIRSQKCMADFGHSCFSVTEISELNLNLSGDFFVWFVSGGFNYYCELKKDEESLLIPAGIFPSETVF